MDKSDSITELAKALSKMQGVLKSVPKDSANPFFKSKYASLDAIWETVRAPLTDNGLSIIQTTFGERIILETTLLHSSGEWVRSYLPINAAKTDPQGIGSALTYARRYSLAAILGVSADEDDDGEATTNHNPKVEPKQTAETKEHWCKEHNTAFFMRGKMKSYAHPIEGTKEWCYEPTKTEPGETIAKANKATMRPLKRGGVRRGITKTVGTPTRSGIEAA